MACYFGPLGFAGRALLDHLEERRSPRGNIEAGCKSSDRNLEACWGVELPSYGGMRLPDRASLILLQMVWSDRACLDGRRPS